MGSQSTVSLKAPAALARSWLVTGFPVSPCFLRHPPGKPEEGLLNVLFLFSHSVIKERVEGDKGATGFKRSTF